MAYTKHDVLLHINIGGEVWEIRTDMGQYSDRSPYCAHVNCPFTFERDEFSGLWSWEEHDDTDVNEGVPWCFFCHVVVPDELIAIRTLLEV